MNSRESRDPYTVLGVPRQASVEEVASAYRRAARASHPDSGGAGSAERFRAVSDAYGVLRDPRRRAVYDRSHPLEGSRTTDAREGSGCYVTPHSQHIVLGRRPPLAGRHPPVAVADIDQARSVWLRRDVEGMFRILVFLLRAGW